MSPSTLMSKKPAATCGDHADEDGVDVRGLEARMHPREHLRQEAVARHRVEDAGLRIHQHEDHRGEADDRADLDDLREPAPGRAEIVDHDGDGIGNVELVVGHEQGHDRRHQHVDDGADDQRADDAERHVLLRVLGFLAGGRDRLEADIGEEDDRGGAHDALYAELAFPLVRRDERNPMASAQVAEIGKDDEPADDDEGDEDAHLDGDDDVVDLGRFRDADAEQGGERGADQEGRQVEQGGDGLAVNQHRRAVLHQRVAAGPVSWGGMTRPKSASRLTT
jgi:hypothetical protein